ncbi:hypothetical protein MMC18_000620 [Xylographa bjoerkii]|nr:hypothetical protein [Xylographa bjoerkii]
MKGKALKIKDRKRGCTLQNWQAYSPAAPLNQMQFHQLTIYKIKTLDLLTKISRDVKQARRETKEGNSHNSTSRTSDDGSRSARNGDNINSEETEQDDEELEGTSLSDLDEDEYPRATDKRSASKRQKPSVGSEASEQEVETPEAEISTETVGSHKDRNEAEGTTILPITPLSTKLTD